MVNGTVDLIIISSKLGVRPSTVRKILEGHPVSQNVQRKIQSALRDGTVSNQVHLGSSVERLLELFQLYQQKRSLQAVGLGIGLSRERVRQLLVKGSKLGFFRYESFRRSLPFVPKEKILGDYRKFLNLNLVARENDISTMHLRKLRALYGITKEQLDRIRLERWKLQCVEEYRCFTARIGRFPTTTELQRNSGAYLSQKITKLWGSISTFRMEHQHSRASKKSLGSPQKEA